MARKGENIYRRKDGRWEGRYIKGRKECGRPVFGYVYGHRYGEVRERLLPLKAMHSGDRGKAAGDWGKAAGGRGKAAGGRGKAAGHGGTFMGFAEAWLGEASRSALRPLKPSTAATYRTLLDAHLLPAFGGRRLDGLSQDDVAAFVKSLLGRGMGVNSARNAAGLLRRIMQAAVARGVLAKNPCEGVALPKRKAVQVSALRVHEQRRLEDAAENDRDGLAVFLALYTGMRIGEICALRWEDVDFESGVMNVRRTVQRIQRAGGRNAFGGGRTEVVFGPPKSDSSVRAVPLAPSLKLRLMAARREGAGEYVIPCGDGFAEPRALRYRFARIVAAAGMAHVRFHSMRHTFATRCVERGVDVTTVSRLLGHSSVKMTLDVYTDSTPERKAAAVRKIDRARAA